MLQSCEGIGVSRFWSFSLCLGRRPRVRRGIEAAEKIVGSSPIAIPEERSAAFLRRPAKEEEFSIASPSLQLRSRRRSIAVDAAPRENAGRWVQRKDVVGALIKEVPAAEHKNGFIQED